MSLIKIKRTSGTGAPSTIVAGELAYSYATGAQDNLGGKLLFGTGGSSDTEYQVIGGKYFTDMLDHVPGTLTASSALLVDSNSKIDNFNVDDINLNGSTISTTTTNASLTFDTNGTGDYIFAGSTTRGDNLLSITDGTNTKFSVDSATGSTSITTGSLATQEEALYMSTTWNDGGTPETFTAIKLDVTDTSSTLTSKLIDLAVGGVSKFSVDKNGNLVISGTLISSGDNAITSIVIPDNTASAFTIKEGVNEYFKIATTDNSELTTLGNSLTSVALVVEDNAATAFVVKEGTNEYIKVTTTNGSELITLAAANVTVSNDLAINGGDLTTGATTFNLLNTTATTVNFAGAATTVSIGAATGTTTINNENTVVTGDLAVNGGDLTTGATTFNLLNTTATTVNFAGAAITMAIGSAAGTVTFGNDVVITGDLVVNGDTVTINTTSLEVEDPLIRLAVGNTSTDSIDIGFVGSYGSTGEKYTGFFRDASNGQYYVFNGAPTTALSSNTIDRAASGFALAKINADEFVGMIDGGTY
jgi:hypothetical protein